MEEKRKEQELWLLFVVSWEKGTKFTKNMSGSYEKNLTKDQWWDLHERLSKPNGRIGLYGTYEFKKAL